MVVVTGTEATVRTLTRSDMLAERDELRRRGDVYDLDAHARGLLARIDSLDFLLANTPA
jgi:hypothetical protein